MAARHQAAGRQGCHAAGAHGARAQHRAACREGDHAGGRPRTRRRRRDRGREGDALAIGRGLGRSRQHSRGRGPVYGLGDGAGGAPRKAGVAAIGRRERWLPTARLAVVKVATPPASTGLVPSSVIPA